MAGIAAILSATLDQKLAPLAESVCRLEKDVEDLKKGAAVAACRRLSVFIGKKSVGELIDLLRDPFLRAKARQ